MRPIFTRAVSIWGRGAEATRRVAIEEKACLDESILAAIE
jgi:hypothetical protein